MNFENFSLKSSIGLSSIMEKYLSNDDAVKGLTHGAPSLSQINLLSNSKDFSSEKRSKLVECLKSQYRDAGVKFNEGVVDQLLLENSFTITTGHQLCIATGPLYFLYKIASTVALTRELKKSFPEKNFVPVFWLASEDHDSEEINHVFLFQKKIVWDTAQTGAVGVFELNEFNAFINEIKDALGQSDGESQWLEILEECYHSPNVSIATRKLVHALFGNEELVIVDGNDQGLKQMFYPVLLSEISERASQPVVQSVSEALESKGLKAQVMPREVNLFYLGDQSRERIKYDGEFSIGNSKFNEDELINELNHHPERFSPNVILRPVYQEMILPNLAYIGGPGELAYWHQLKGVFELYKTQFPSLVLRDSALLLSSAIQKKMTKLNLNTADVFRSQKDIINQWLEESGVITLDEEKSQLELLFQTIAQKAQEVDPTLHAFALGEGKRQLSSLENVEKKIVKAFKTKEEQRILQLEKIWTEIFPDHQPQERVANIGQFMAELPSDFIEQLISHFNPLKNELKVIRL